MPIKHAIWTVGEKPAPLPLSQLSSEQLLEDMIEKDPTILSDNWMLIGRQEVTPFGGRTDLLAIDPSGNLVLIELKRHRTPREIVAQALDYAAWVGKLTSDKIAQIYQRYSKGGSINDAFKARFGTELDEETLNESHQIILVAAELDYATERIIRYLNERDVAINVFFFQIFQRGTEQLLSRAWYIDPGETQINAATYSKGTSSKEPWNGEFYVSFGGAHRSWEEARKHGFISGGGGSWYSQTLKLLSSGDLVWVKIPKRGYVGVARVIESVQPVSEFQIDGKPCLEVLSTADQLSLHANDPEMAEYFVRVEWLDTVNESSAFDGVGLFGNQNTVCQPVTPKWRHTVERLKSKFKNWENKTPTP
ncbi:hypothetical protein VDG1235_1900 [Verrucomicrobiia bacterium DG1235]|nr:hypothetical protein VDG1235_1900 [Verrucomicrobiae bacterium DG1235]